MSWHSQYWLVLTSNITAFPEASVNFFFLWGWGTLYAVVFWGGLLLSVCQA